MKLLFTILLLFSSSILFTQSASQELISSAGSHFENGSISISWSIGESITATHSNGDYIITQGFHQNNYIITSVENLATGINIFVYPNPTSDFITINIGNSTFEGGQGDVTLRDLYGKILIKEDLNETEKQFNFAKFPSGVYFLTVKQDTQIIKTFKIIKK